MLPIAYTMSGADSMGGTSPDTFRATDSIQLHTRCLHGRRWRWRHRGGLLVKRSLGLFISRASPRREHGADQPENREKDADDAKNPAPFLEGDHTDREKAEDIDHKETLRRVSTRAMNRP